MKKTKNNETKERKSFKELIVENKCKIFIGVSIITIGGISYMLYKNAKNVKDIKEIMAMHTETLSNLNDFNESSIRMHDDEIAHMVITRNIAEEGALEEAINAVKRKIQYRVTKLEGLKNRGNDPEALLSKQVYEKELEELKNKLETFEKIWNDMVH